MYSLTEDQYQSAQGVMARSGANNLCLFVYSARPKTTGVNFLCHYGMTEKVHRDYSAGLWAHDPFLLSLAGGCLSPTLLERRELEGCNDVSRPYWQYIDQVGYKDIVASIHPFSDEVFLVGGLMVQAAGSSCDSIKSGKVLEELDMLVSSAVGDMVDQGLRMLFPTGGLAAKATALNAPAVYLTPRERDVVLALKEGRGNKQIAASLSLSEYTIENHFKRLFRKFAVSNRTALLSQVQRLGLL